MTTQIAPNQMEKDVPDRLVNSPDNPGNCPCGWYIYYSAVCGHEYKAVKFECNHNITPTGRSAFCKTPAPRNIVQAVQIDAQCPHC
ncbi:hypothetical protein N7467_004364 [Penicillium canescens]|nr:hypothetical protein N7467_004364 [Penicillium canescens]